MVLRHAHGLANQVVLASTSVTENRFGIGYQSADSQSSASSFLIQLDVLLSPWRD